MGLSYHLCYLLFDPTDIIIFRYLKKQYVTPHVEKSANNHFMFWKPKKLDPNYVPPTTVVSDITFDKWLQLAHQADEKKLESEAEHVYFMLSANSHKGSNNFISTDLGKKCRLVCL